MSNVVDAITRLLVMDLSCTKRPEITLKRGYTLCFLSLVVRRNERRGFPEGDAALVRSTLSRTVPGHGYSFGPDKRLTQGDRLANVEGVKAAGWDARLVKVSGRWSIQFQE